MGFARTSCYGKPLAELASGWLSAGVHPNWITGGTLFGLDDGGAKAVILGLVDQAPTTMGAEVQENAHPTETPLGP